MPNKIKQPAAARNENKKKNKFLNVWNENIRYAFEMAHIEANAIYFMNKYLSVRDTCLLHDHCLVNIYL